MVGVDEQSQPGGRFFHRRVGQRADIDPVGQELLRQDHRHHRVSHNHRHHRRKLAGPRVEPRLLGQVAHQGRILLQTSDPARVLLHKPQGGQGGRRAGGRKARTVDKARSGMFQIVDQFVAAGHKPAARTERLAEGPHPDVDIVRVDAEVFAYAAPRFAQRPQRVPFVDHQPRLVAVADLDQLRQGAHVPFHAVNPFGHDQHAAVILADVVQNLVELAPIVVWERTPPSARQVGAGDYAAMGHGVVQDQVAGTQQVPDGGLVGGMSARHQHGTFDPQELGQRGLHLAMEVPLARDQPTAAGACP